MIGHQADGEQGTQDEAISYPPKYIKNEERKGYVWLKSIISLALYLVLGYYIFHSFNMLLLITGIVLLHEMGHFLAMKAFRYKDLGIFFIPLLGAYVSGSKREVSQRESAIILLAGPLPGMIIGIFLYWLYTKDPSIEVKGISLYTISLSMLLLNLVNLLPIYPLDGGQLLNRVFLDEDGWISRIFVILSVAAMVWFALYGLGTPVYPLLIFPAMILLRSFGDKKLNRVEKQVETEGFDLNKSYDELSNEDYWKIRNILIREHASFKDMSPAPPFEYDQREEKVMVTIEGLLHRNLIQDLSWPGKTLILLIWIAALISPWLMRLELGFLERFSL